MELSHYIDLAKEKSGSTTDSELSKFIGLDRSTVGSYRNKRRNMDNYVCLQLAQIIGCDPLEIIIAASLTREKNRDKKEFWLDQYALLPKRAILSLIPIAGIVILSHSLIQAPDIKQVSNNSIVHYVLC